MSLMTIMINKLKRPNLDIYRALFKKCIKIVQHPRSSCRYRPYWVDIFGYGVVELPFCDMDVKMTYFDIVSAKAGQIKTVDTVR